MLKKEPKQLFLHYKIMENIYYPFKKYCFYFIDKLINFFTVLKFQKLRSHKIPEFTDPREIWLLSTFKGTNLTTDF